MSNLKEKALQVQILREQLAEEEQELVRLEAEAAKERSHNITSFTQELMARVPNLMGDARVSENEENILTQTFPRDLYSGPIVEVGSVCERKGYVSAFPVGAWNKSYPNDEAIRVILYVPRDEVNDLLEKYNLNEN